MFKQSLFCIAGLVFLTSAYAQQNDAEHRTKFNYQMFCQGCHAADGAGHKSVPTLKGTMHKFMASQLGREYLIQVPGAANSVLDDEELTDVMNWMLHNFTNYQSMPNYRPYKVSEVSEYRRNPLYETINYRKSLVGILNLEPDS